MFARRLVLFGLLGSLGCSRAPPDRGSDEQAATQAPRQEARLGGAEPPAQAEASCAERIRRVLADPAAPGATDLEQARTRILMRAKGEPLVFLRPPATAASDAVVRAEARRLARTRHPYEVLRELMARFSASRELLRQIVLREGYLLGGSPELAFVLTELLRADQLFADPVIWVQRGARTLHGSRNQRGRYVWLDGAERGRPLRLLHGDRVGSGGEPPAALHVDLRALLHQLHFERLRIRHLTDAALVADLRYGEHWVQTLLGVTPPRVELVCEIGAPEVLQQVTHWRRRAVTSSRALQALRAAMLAQIDEALPFDEPLSEVGQQDGRLRPAWRAAYFRGEQSYRFGPDRYPVFDAQGRPLPPQVCIDFLVDTLERASGTSFAPRGMPPERHVGRLDLWGTHGDQLRSAFYFTEFVRSRPEAFEVLSIPESERIEFRREARLHDFLLERADDFRPGDIVLIRGWTPWDPEEMHYHSAFVYEQDPITGFPILLAGNAGRPSLRHLTTELWRTPRRSIRLRVRPLPSWLEAIVAPDAALAPTPPPLIAGP